MVSAMKNKLWVGIVLGALLMGSALWPVLALPAPPMPEGRDLPKSTSALMPIASNDPGLASSLANQITLPLDYGDPTAMQDAYLYEYEPDGNFGAPNGALLVRSFSGFSYRSIMRFDLDVEDIPPGSHIDSATLSLYAFARTQPLRIDLSFYKVLTAWEEDAVSWNSATASIPWESPGCDAAGFDRSSSPYATGSIYASDPVPAWYNWDVTSLVQEWRADPSHNYGLLVVASGSASRYDFFSSEGGSSDLRPKLYVHYSEPSATQTPTETPQLTATPTAGYRPTPTTPSVGSGVIQGMVYEDVNGNGRHDAGESGLPGAKLELRNSDGYLVGSQWTGSDGLYSFTGLVPDTYRVGETNPPGYTSTTIDAINLPLGEGAVWTWDFGDRLTISLTPSATPSVTQTSDATRTATPTCTQTVFHTETPTIHPSITPSLTPTPTRTLTPTITRTPTRTLTPTLTRTVGPSPTPTETPISWIDVANAIPASCKGVFAGDTTGKANNAHHYGDVPWLETGPEDVYVLQKTVASDLTVLLQWSATDLDVFMLFADDPAALYAGAYGDTGFTAPNLAPGTYYIVVDGYQGAEGAYWLSIECEGEPTPTATTTATMEPTNTPAISFYPLVFDQPTPTPTNTATPTNTPTPAPYEKAVNCGGTSGYLASDGYWYAADKAYASGSWGWYGGVSGIWTTSSGIKDTGDDPIYQVHRYGMDAYRFTVPWGRYEVALRFAEIFPYISVGQRVFAVELEGDRVLDQYDMLTEGARLRAVDKTFEVDVVDGRMRFVCAG